MDIVSHYLVVKFVLFFMKRQKISKRGRRRPIKKPSIKHFLSFALLIFPTLPLQHISDVGPGYQYWAPHRAKTFNAVQYEKGPFRTDQLSCDSWSTLLIFQQVWNEVLCAYVSLSCIRGGAVLKGEIRFPLTVWPDGSIMFSILAIYNAETLPNSILFLPK